MGGNAPTPGVWGATPPPLHATAYHQDSTTNGVGGVMGCRGQRPQLVCHQQPLPLKVAHSFSGCGDHGLIYNLNRLFAQIFYYLFTPQPGGLTPQLRTGRSLGWGRNSGDETVGAKRGAEGWVSWGLGPGCWRLGPSRGRREGLDLQSWGRFVEPR